MSRCDYLYSIIGANIRRLRISLGKTQSLFAEEVGISESFVKQLENEYEPKGVSLDTLVRIADTYNIELTYFFEGYNWFIYSNTSPKLPSLHNT